MLGLRGVRLGIAIPGLFTMQARRDPGGRRGPAQGGRRAEPEIMIPLVATCGSSTSSEAEIQQIATAVQEEQGIEIPHLIGTMIELPRAALTAGQIAGSADFFSFGTNDLTQMTWGFSRDDVEASFFSTYLEQGIFPVSPFESLDTEGVGALVRTASEAGREVERRPQARRLRRARRRPGLDPLLRVGRARLRLLLAVPGAGRAVGGRPLGAG